MQQGTFVPAGVDDTLGTRAIGMGPLFDTAIRATAVAQNWASECVVPGLAGLLSLCDAPQLTSFIVTESLVSLHPPALLPKKNV